MTPIMDLTLWTHEIHAPIVEKIFTSSIDFRGVRTAMYQAPNQSERE
jgi:hypothetical protein